jgi:glutathione S-transferase
VELIIGNKNYSSWSLRAWLLLSAYELPFKETRVPLGDKDATTTLADYSKAAKVPVLYDRNAVIWDSLAICEYVSEQYLQNKGWPEDAIQRAEARSCSAEMHSGFFTIRELLPMNCRASGRRIKRTENLNKEIKRIDNMWTELRSKYDADGPWLFGEFSIADCMFAPVVMRFFTYDIKLSQSSCQYMETLRRHEKIQYWLADAIAETETIASEEVGQ